ncbi:ribonuclease R [Caldinitratiruptor microaerophilus]|uniref:Ribonuclease R n=1 Tax=Caldinitratiruptor microaerophilus TaxID=671077 RepID=A0AA35CLJ4_9FIRM|nr:ribonuclease R [Caldinitratiruptor microaerophilus]BDG61544.1 ribonuclease R [Caldinitratiruptor microaerophilus]
MKERIAAFIRSEAYRPLTAAELFEAMEIPEQQRPEAQAALDRMEAEGLVVRTRTGRYGAPERMNLAVGRIQAHPKGFAFLTPEVQPEGVEGDVFIGPEDLMGAMHGDRVVVRLSPPSRPRARTGGEVIRILERAVRRIVGTYEGNRQGGYVVPDDPRYGPAVVVPRGGAGGAKAGEKVVARITRYPEGRRPAEGHVVERLGKPDDPGVDVLSIIRRHELPEAFPARVLREAERIPGTIPPEEFRQRTDLRELPFVTIDGEDAKDFDDAVLVRREGKRWRLWVAIADVSWYVREGSALDREALRRGTSVYLADRVVPMLPPRLSDDLCSLRPGEDRLVLVCEMEIGPRGGVSSHKIYPAVIRSRHRLTYTAVHRMLEERDPALREQYADVVPMLETAHELMRVLRQKRIARGSLEFELPEAELVLSERGEPLDVLRAARTDAHRIIEEFMLAANETVAEHYARLKVPFVYRVHEEPDPDRIAALAEFLGLFGYTLRPGKAGVEPRDLQAVTAWVRGRKEEGLVNTVVLRSLKQARYSHENLGHFGLATRYYCHFTSPIRRYPDLMVHRIIRELWAGGGRLSPRRTARLERLVAEVALQSSERERVAMEAERETYDLKKAQFMRDKVGEVWDAVISGVTNFGFFVQLPNTVEGLVHVSTLADDYYHFHEKLYALVGERTRRTFRLGDPVRVRLLSVDLEARQVNFALEEPVPGEDRVESGSRTGPEAKSGAGSGRHGRGRRGRRAERRAAKRARADGAARERPAVDMWGIPIPAGRQRPRPDDEEEDAQVGVVFALPATAGPAPPPAREAGREPGAPAAPATGGRRRRKRREGAAGPDNISGGDGGDNKE